jgi:hypothetical protein
VWKDFERAQNDERLIDTSVIDTPAAAAAKRISPHIPAAETPQLPQPPQLPPEYTRILRTARTNLSVKV